MSARKALLPLAASLALVAGSCGGSQEPIQIGLLADCEGFVASFFDVTLAGAELPLVRRGAAPAGQKPTDGVESAEIGGHPIELSFGCATETTKGTLEARRLVELEQVDLLIGPNIGPTGAVLAVYAKRHPEVTFVIPSGEMLAHLGPGENVFRSSPTFAQVVAGLGAYAYDELGWRRATTIGGADSFTWGFQAGFVAEFCSLGGQIVDRVWLDTFPEEVPALLAEIPTGGVDGFFLAVDSYSAGAFLEQHAERGSNLGRTVIATGSALALEPTLAARLGDDLVGIVTAGDLPPASPELGAYAKEYARAFPEVAETAGATLHTFDLPFHNAMEAVLRALEAVDGDLSDGQRRFRAALAQTELDAPNGHLKLDRNRSAVTPTYLLQVAGNDRGTLSYRPIRTIEDVDASFGGRFGPGSPAPDRTQPPCERGNPPPWASGGW